jgi:hypothetical protein
MQRYGISAMFTESKCGLMSARRHCKIPNRAKICWELGQLSNEKIAAKKSQRAVAAFSRGNKNFLLKANRGECQGGCTI